MIGQFKRCPVSRGGAQCQMEQGHRGAHAFADGGQPTVTAIDIDAFDRQLDEARRLLEQLTDQIWRAERQRMNDLLAQADGQGGL